MQKRTKHFLMSAMLLCGISFMLVGCEDDYDSSSGPAKPVSYQKAKQITKHKDKGRVYKLAFFDYMGTNDTHELRYALGYYKGTTLYKKVLNSDNNYFREVVSPGLKVPYVYINENHYYIHRPPNNMYNQPVIKGKITEKLK